MARAAKSPGDGRRRGLFYPFIGSASRSLQALHRLLREAEVGVFFHVQRRFDEAKQHLQRAIEGSAQSYLAHYYYAFTLSREGVGEDQVVSCFAPEKAEIMRRELTLQTRICKIALVVAVPDSQDREPTRVVP